MTEHPVAQWSNKPPMWVFSPLWDAPDYSSLCKRGITAPLITRHNQTPSTVWCYNVRVYKVQTESIYTYGLCAMGRDTSVDRRAPLNHRSSEKPGPGPSSAITNVYCSRSERMLCGILEQTNTPQPRQGINTGSPPRPPHRKQLCGRGCGGQLKTHMPRYVNIHGHIYRHVTFRISEVVDFISLNHETDFWSSSKIWLLVSDESCMVSSWSFSSWTCFKLMEHLGQVG